MVVEIPQAFADARAASPPGGQEVQAFLRSPRVGVAQRFTHARDAGVKDEAMHVRELRTERAREPQMEKAVLTHRPADIQQQDEARTHTAAVLPGQPERRATAADAAP